jgi:hypothetical protein
MVGLLTVTTTKWSAFVFVLNSAPATIIGRPLATTSTSHGFGDYFGGKNIHPTPKNVFRQLVFRFYSLSTLVWWVAIVGVLFLFISPLSRCSKHTQINVGVVVLWEPLRPPAKSHSASSLWLTQLTQNLCCEFIVSTHVCHSHNNNVKVELTCCTHREDWHCCFPTELQQTPLQRQTSFEHERSSSSVSFDTISITTAVAIGTGAPHVWLAASWFYGFRTRLDFGLTRSHTQEACGFSIQLWCLTQRTHLQQVFLLPSCLGTITHGVCVSGNFRRHFVENSVNWRRCG